jgi:hypothetical protein
MMVCFQTGGGGWSGGGGEWFVSSVMVTAAGDMYIVTVPIHPFSIFMKKLQKVGFASYFCEAFTSVKLFTKKNCIIFSQSAQLLFTQKLKMFITVCENISFCQKHKRQKYDEPHENFHFPKATYLRVQTFFYKIEKMTFVSTFLRI